MTTIRRELRTRFEGVLGRFSDKLQLPEREAIADLLADAALEVAGISKQKFHDPMWDLFHGEEISLEAAQNTEAIHNVALRLEAGLRRGQFPETPLAQSVYKWILAREQGGQKLETWMDWATDGRRTEFTFQYHKDPMLIKRDWLQVNWPKKTDEIKGSGFYA